MFIKGQGELLEKPTADLFDRLSRDHVKETAEVNREYKESYLHEGSEWKIGPFARVTQFQRQKIC